MQNQSYSGHLWLEKEFLKRREKNPRYSLRAFANHLQIHPGRVSEILSQKRRLTPKLAEKIADRLLFSPEAKKRFFSSVRNITHENYTQLDEDSFYLISDWYHYAILSLTETRNFRFDKARIARRLGISNLEVQAAFERLLRLGLLNIKNGKLLKTQKNLTTTHDKASIAIRRSHKQILNKALQALDEVDLDQRDITSMCMSINPKDLPIAKEMIKKFRRKFCRTLDTKRASEVYYLNIQLIPVTRKD